MTRRRSMPLARPRNPPKLLETHKCCFRDCKTSAKYARSGISAVALVGVQRIAKRPAVAQCGILPVAMSMLVLRQPGSGNIFWLALRRLLPFPGSAGTT